MQFSFINLVRNWTSSVQQRKKEGRTKHRMLKHKSGGKFSSYYILNRVITLYFSISQSDIWGYCWISVLQWGRRKRCRSRLVTSKKLWQYELGCWASDCWKLSLQVWVCLVFPVHIMGDIYKYPVFFECSKLSAEQRKRIENYFHIRRKSGGGECGSVTHVNDKVYSVAFKERDGKSSELIWIRVFFLSLNVKTILMAWKWKYGKRK